ncbi:MAG TPA: hypothetical protein VGG19_05925, partial [Tepidisphaeraceae bacterium]
MGWLREMFTKRKSATARSGGTPRICEANIRCYHQSRSWLEQLEGRQYLSDPTFHGFTFHSGNSTTDSQLAALFSSGTGAGTNPVSFDGQIQANGQNISGNFEIKALDNTETNYQIWSQDSSVATTLASSLASLSSGSVSSGSPWSLTSGGNISGNLASGSVSVSEFSAVSLSPTSLSWNSGGNVSLGTSGSVTAGSGSVSGTFTLGSSGSNVSVTIAGGSITLSAGGASFSASGISGTLTVQSNGVVGTVSGSAQSFNADGIAFSGNFGVSVDTTSSDKNFKIHATGATLTLSNISITTDIDLEVQTGAGQTYIGAELQNTTASISVGGNQVVSFSSEISGSQQQGYFLFQDPGNNAGETGMVGDIAGTITVTASGTGGASDSVEALIEINTLPATSVVNSTTTANNFDYPDPFNTGQTPPATVPILGDSGLQIFARGLDLHLNSSQEITGDFYFAATASTVTFSAANVTANFGDVSLANGTGNLTIDSGGITGSVSGDVTFTSGGVNASGTFGVSIADGSVTVVGTDVTITVDSEKFTGNFSIIAGSTSTEFDVTDASLFFGSAAMQINNLSGSFTLGSSSSSDNLQGDFDASIGGVSFTGEAGITVSDSDITLSGNTDTLTIGDQTVTGDFTASDSAGTITLGGSNISASLGNGLVTIGGASSFSISIGTNSVSGSFSGTVSAGSGQEFSFTGPFTVSIDSTDGISATGGSIGTPDTLTVNGANFGGIFAFSESGLGLEIAVSDISLDVGSGALSITNAHGTLLVSKDSVTSDTSVSGDFGATFTSNVASFQGTLEITFNTDGTYTLAATDTTFNDGNGDSVTGDMTITVSGSTLNMAATNLQASLGNGLVTIGPPVGGTASSTLQIDNGNFSGTFTGVVSVGSATGVGFSGPITVSVSNSSISASGNGDTLTIAGQNISASFDFEHSGSTLDLDISGVSFAIGSLISVSGASGTLQVTSTGVTGSASGTVTQSIAGFTGSLGVGFAPGSIDISGTGDKITFGSNEFISGDFNFTDNASGLQLSANNFEASFANGLVLVQNGSATLSVNSTTGAITGSFSGDLSATTSNFSLAGTISVAVGNGGITASGTGDSVTLFGITLSGGFTFSEDASGNLDLAVTGLNFSPAGSAFSITSASGTLHVDSSGISGSTSGNISSTLAGLSGTFGVGFDPVNGLSVSGTNDTLAVGGQSISGDFDFTLSGSNATLNIANASVNLGGGFVQVTNGTASVAFTGTTLTSGSFSGSLSIGTASTAQFSGPVTGTITPTSITASGSGDTVTIAGQSLTGSFSFAYDSTNKEIDLGLSGVSLSIGSIISVNIITGTVDITSAGVSGSVTGSLASSSLNFSGSTAFGIMFSPSSIGISVTGAALNIGGQSLGGDFDFVKDTSGIHLTSSNMTADLGGGLVSVTNGSANLNVSTAGVITGSFTATVQAGTNFTASGVGFSGTVTVTVAAGSISASGTNDTLTIAGNKLITNFSFSKDATGIQMGVSNLSLSLANNAVSISQASGTLQVTSTGITGSASGTIATNLSSVTLGGDLAITFGGGSISITGTNDTLTAGGQTISGSFNFTSDSTGLHLSASNFQASLGNGLVTISNGSGTLDITNGSVTGSFSGSLAVGGGDTGFSLSGSIAVSVGNGTISAATIPGQDDTLAVAGQQITAGFSFVKNSSGLQLTLSDLSFSVGGVVNLTDGSGTLNVASDGVSGSVMGTISTSFTGFTFAGTLAVTFAPGTIQVSGTNDSLTAGGQTITGDFTFLDDSTGVHLTANNFGANFGNGIVVISGGSGTLDIVSGAISGSFSGTVAAGTGDSGFSFSGPIAVSFGGGSFSASTPDGQTDTLIVLGQTLSAGFDFSEDSTGVHLTLSDVNLSFAGGAIQVINAGGTVNVSKSGISGSIMGGLSANIPNVTFNATNFSIAFDPTSLAISGTGVSLTAYGQTISGNFTFSDSNNTLSLEIDNLALSIANIVNVTNGTGNFTLTTGTNGGMTGSASGNVSITGLGNSIQFGGTYAVSIGNGTTSVSGTGDSLTIFGQKLIGNFSFTKTADSVDLHINSLDLSLGGGLVMVTGGAADLTVDSTGITGDASGTISVGSSEAGFTIGGTVSVNFSPTNLTVEDDNATFTLPDMGLTLSADKLLFSRDSATGDLAVTVTNVSLSLSGQPAPVSFSGQLLVMAAGLSGTMTAAVGPATITVSFGNGQYQIAAGISTSFSETLGPISISGTVDASVSTGSQGTAGQIVLDNLTVDMGNGLLTITGGQAKLNTDGHTLSGSAIGTVMLNGVPDVSLSGTVSLDFTPSSLSVTGTDMNLSVLGQTLSGDFSFSDNGDGTIKVGVDHLNLSLAGGVVSVTDGSGDFEIGSEGAEKGIKGTASAQVAINVPDVSFASDLSLNIDTTNNQSTFVISGNPVVLNFAGQSLSGNFTLQKVTTAKGVSTMSLVVSNATAFVGAGAVFNSDGTVDTTNATGVDVTDGNGAVLILSTGVALDVSGTAALIGVSNLTLGGTVHVLYNNTGSDVNESLPAPGNTTFNLDVADGASTVEGTATLGIQNNGNTFVSLTGGFYISKTSSTTGNTTLTQVVLAAAGLNAFIGNGAVTNSDGSLDTTNAQGVLIQNADLGLAIFSSVDNTNPNSPVKTTTFGLTASGAASILGIPGLTLSGTLSVQDNTAGSQYYPIDVNVPDPINPGSTIPVNLDFTGNQLPSFAGSVNLIVANPSDLTQQFVTFSGDFNFTQPDANTISVAVTNVNAFVGIGGATPVGLQIANGSLGLLLIHSGSSTTYALDASGTISLVGLPGLIVSGTLTVMSNTTGQNQTNPADGTTNIPSGAFTVQLDNGDFAILDSSGNKVIDIGVTATITKSGSDLAINATNVSFTLNINGTQIFQLQGMVNFTLGPDGFKLGSGYALNGFSILDQPIIAPPQGTGSSHAPPAAGPATSPSTTPGSSGAPSSIPAAPTLPSESSYKLGPLTVYGLAPIFKDFSFSGGELEVTLGLSADAAALSFGSNSNGNNPGNTEAILTNFAGSLQMEVGLDLSSFRVTSFGPTGKFSFTAGEFYLNVPNVVNVTAQNIAITYDPKADDTQQIISIGTATVTVPLGSGGNGIQGQISPYTDSSGNIIPGLVVYGDHFVLGTATIKYLGTLSIGSIVQFVNPYISVSDLSVSFNGSLDFNGSISIGADSVTLGPSSFQVTGTSVKATLTDNGGNWSFVFQAGQIGFSLAGILKMSASNVYFNPDAGSSDALLSLSSVQVTVSLSALTLTGTAGSPTNPIVIQGDGTVVIPDNFTIGVTISAGTSGGLGWPSWIPIQIQSISLTWPSFESDEENIILDFSASMNGSIGPIQLSGSVQDVQISIEDLIDGSFPIIGIGSFGVSATGNVFGGTLSASIVMGIVQLDASGHQLPPTAPAGSAANRIMYFGVEGGFVMPELGGLDIRFGMSQNGPLEAYIQLDPGPGIPIVPPIGLAIVGLSGGITFDATPFPTISNAMDLKDPVFTSGVLLSLTQWEAQLRQETVNQAGGGGGGYLFSITSPSSTDITALNDGTIASDTNIINTFLNNGDVLSKTVTSVKEVDSTEWLIHDSGSWYLIVKDGSGNLEVSEYRFVIDAPPSGDPTGATSTVPMISQIVTDLNSGQVTQNVINAFAAYGITLPTSGATVTTQAPTPGQTANTWVIAVGGFKYYVTKDSAGLLTVLSQGGSMSALNGVIRIEASVSLGLEGVPASEFSATGDIIIETDGKILLSVNATFGSSLNVSFKLYLDLSKVTNGQVSILFYFEQDVAVPGDPSLTFPELVVAGGVEMGLTDALGNFINLGDPNVAGFGFHLSGEIIYSFLPGISLTFTGEADIAFVTTTVNSQTSTRMLLGFDATLSANIENFIQANNIVTAAGSFVLQFTPSVQVWGAAEIQFTAGSIPFLA